MGGVAAPSKWQPFRWQGKRLLSPNQSNLYDSRARVWSADLGAFLQPDEYVFLSHTGTLWSWPGQNPYRWRDPSGRDAEEWFLRNADTLQNGALGVASAALTVATFGAAAELSAALLSGEMTLGAAAEGAAVGALKGGAFGAAVDAGKQAFSPCSFSTEELARAAAAGAVNGALFGAHGAIPGVPDYTGIGSTGQVGEDALKTLGGDSQQYFRTSLGGRYVDQLVDGAAHESKVGYTSLTDGTAKQVAKDSELLNTGQVDSYTWHFFTSPVTGLGGPSAPLRDVLEQAGITIVEH